MKGLNMNELKIGDMVRITNKAAIGYGFFSTIVAIKPSENIGNLYMLSQFPYWYRRESLSDKIESFQHGLKMLREELDNRKPAYFPHYEIIPVTEEELNDISIEPLLATLSYYSKRR